MESFQEMGGIGLFVRREKLEFGLKFYGAKFDYDVRRDLHPLVFF